MRVETDRTAGVFWKLEPRRREKPRFRPRFSGLRGGRRIRGLKRLLASSPLGPVLRFFGFIESRVAADSVPMRKSDSQGRLQHALSQQDVEAFQYALDDGADANALILDPAGTGRKIHMLHYILRPGTRLTAKVKGQMAQILLERGADREAAAKSARASGEKEAARNIETFDHDDRIWRIDRIVV